MRSHDYDLDFRDRARRVRAWGIGLSVPVSVAGAMLFTGGSVSSRMSAHAEAVRMLDGLAERPPTKQQS
ncbi:MULTISPECIES: hypothetical protein [Streptomyces]|uniref:hypothetical protein n=1 Tax=Streptomyces TaxID=1883 RepID=UPI0007CD5645|nr:hypothetical protein A4V12_29660 [Streptomyces noursei]